MFLVALHIFSLFLSKASACDLFLVGLNEGVGEQDACEAGVAANNNGDRLQIIEGYAIDKDILHAQIKAVLDSGRCIDSIVISGHDGSGEFYGHRGGIRANDIQEIVRREPRLAKTLTSMALWGCNSVTPEGCENYWLKKTGPNVKLALGFSGPAPLNVMPKNTELLGDFCRRRNEGVKAQNEGELCGFFQSLRNTNPYELGICAQGGVASRTYSPSVDRCLATKADLDRQCQTHLPAAIDQEITNYFAAGPGRYKNPPTNPSWQDKLHKYYGALTQWYHCRQFSNYNGGKTILSPAQVIRLTFFDTFKRNFYRNHKEKIEQYDEELRRAGLDACKLGDITAASRAEIVGQTKCAVNALQKAGRPELLDKALKMDATLRELSPNCSSQDWIMEGSDLPSHCWDH